MECTSKRKVYTKKGIREYVPCGQCRACRIKLKEQWIFRLMQEEKNSISSYFLTITYNDHYLPLVDGIYPSVSKEDIKKFFKRLRERERKLEPKRKIKIKYFLVAEYGEKTNRPHYHALIFNVRKVENIDLAWSERWYNGNEYENIPMGDIHYGRVEQASIGYTLKYIWSQSQEKPYAASLETFRLISNGIGESFNKHKEHYKKNKTLNYVAYNGKKVKLPKYYSEKWFTDEEKEERKKLIEPKKGDFEKLRDEENLNNKEKKRIIDSSKWKENLQVKITKL